MTDRRVRYFKIYALFIFKKIIHYICVSFLKIVNEWPNISLLFDSRLFFYL